MKNIDPKLLEVLACPNCKGKLKYDKTKQELFCSFDKVIYPIKDGVPIMLIKKAKPINGEV